MHWTKPVQQHPDGGEEHHKGRPGKHTKGDQRFATEATEFEEEVNIYNMGVAY